MGAPEHRGPLRRSDRSDVPHTVAVDVGLDLVAEVPLVLDDAGDDQAPTGGRGDRDGLGRALVGVDPPEEQQVVAGAGSTANASTSMPWWIVAA